MAITPTPHIAATYDQIAKRMLMPGDPKRSRYIATTFLEIPVLVNDIRVVQGYTGTYKGVPVTVMASGMGIPSIGLYTYELFNFYDVEKIIRVGTAGSIDEKLNVGDVLISDIAYTDSGFLDKFDFGADYVPKPSPEMLADSIEIAKEKGMSYVVGPVLTAELYYTGVPTDFNAWHDKGVLSVEMEAACLYANAVLAKKKALSMFTVSNSILTGVEMPPEERETSFGKMIGLALDTVIR